MRAFAQTSLLAFVLIGASCSAPKSELADAAPAPPATERLEPYSCGSIERLHTLGGVFLASQPGKEELEKAAANGIRTVLDLRKPGELTEFDERAEVERLGMAYVNVPFSKPEELTDEVLDRAREILNDPTLKPMLVHCHSANRVGAVWLAHRVLDGGVDYPAALAEARTVGLKSPALEERAKRYVDARARP
jgi:uncharacterized protein (TIGR01244 family)